MLEEWRIKIRMVSIPSADPEGGTGGPDPLENHKLYWFL